VIQQQVNLFQPIFRRERKLLSFRVLLQASAAVVVVLVLLYGWGVQQSRQIQTDLALLQGLSDQRSVQRDDVATRLASRKPDTGLQQQLARLERELAARRKVVDALTRVRDSYSQGVSGYLESFSRRIPKGVWLTGFNVAAGGEGLVIRGSALKPALIPVFLQQLSTEPTLSGTHFGLLQILREEADDHSVDFTVYTGSEPPPEPTLGADR